MSGKKIARAAAAVVLAAALMLTAPCASQPASATTLSELQQKQDELKQKSADLDAQLQQLKNDAAKQQEYKNTLDEKIVTLEQQIDSRDAEIRQLDADIVKKEEAISGKQKEIEADFVKLKQRVYALYLTGETTNLEIVLNAKNIMDLADKSEILRVISEHDTDLMNSLKSDIESIKEQKAEIEKNRAEVSSARTELEADQQQLRALSDESAKVIAALQQSQQEIESEQEQCRIDQSAAKAAVDKWLQDYYASQKAASSASSGSGSGGATGAAPPVPRSRPTAWPRWSALRSSTSAVRICGEAPTRPASTARASSPT